jgi:hypothetical protein
VREGIKNRRMKEKRRRDEGREGRKGREWEGKKRGGK